MFKLRPKNKPSVVNPRRVKSNSNVKKLSASHDLYMSPNGPNPVIVGREGKILGK